MPLFDRDTASAKLVVYFPDERPCFSRLSFDGITLRTAIEKFENAIKQQKFGSFDISNYQTALIYNQKTKEIVVKYVKGKKII